MQLPPFLNPNRTATEGLPQLSNSEPTDPAPFDLLRKDLDCAAIHSTQIVLRLQNGDTAHALAETLTLQSDLNEMLKRLADLDS